MRWLDSLRMQLRMLFRRGREGERLGQELQFHLDQQIAENVAAGMSPEEARRAALRKFGNATLVREKTHETWSWTWLERLAQDVSFATRQIARAPGFAIIAIVTLALGIGANSAIFTLTHSLLLSSLPIQEPDRLVRLSIDMHDSQRPDAKNAELALPMIESIARRSKTLNGIFGWSVYDFVLKEGDSMHGIHGATVSGNAFQVLGTRPAAGRLLVSADDQPGGGPDGWAGVLSHRTWVQNYHADPAVVGRHITVTDRNVTIVGVAPEGFEGVLVAEHPDLYLPLEFDGALNGEQGLHSGGQLWLTTFARLKPGVSRAQAAAEMTAIFPAVKEEVLPPPMRHLPEVQKAQLAVDPGRTGWSRLRAQYTEPLLLLQLLVGAVLLICCANLSGLFLARASARQQEFAIRGALGAPRLRLMRQLFVESLMLALPGAALGVLLAWLAGPLLLHALGSREAEESLSSRPDLAVLSVSAGCALLCALLFGMAPAWTASHVSVEAALRGSHRGATAGNAGARRFFVPFQVALSLTLVVVAALLGSTVIHLRTEDSGYRTENVMFILTDFNRVPEKGADLAALYRRMVARMQGSPGIDSASVAEIPPFLGWRNGGLFMAAGNAAHAEPSQSNVNVVLANFFKTLGTRMLAGRDFLPGEDDQDSCILNQAAAQQFFPQATALGNSLRQVRHNFMTGTDTTSTCQVVGIVQDTKYASLHDSHPPIVYLPITKDTEGLSALFFVLHGRSIAEEHAAYHAAMHEMAPTSPETEPFLFTQQFSDSIAREQLLSILSGFFALLALLLSGIGIYGLVAWNVTQRTTEIGVRMALGATRGRVFLMVMRQVAILLAVGVAVGGIAAFFAARSIRSFLFEVQPGNVGVFVLSALVLVAICPFANSNW
jgi:predicted permease